MERSTEFECSAVKWRRKPAYPATILAAHTNGANIETLVRVPVRSEVMTSLYRICVLAFAALTAIIGVAIASDEVRHVDVHFAAGESSATLTDTITGYGSVDYLLDARAGQTMSVVFEPSSTAAYFNIYEPGKGPGEEAMFIGAVNGNEYAGVLPLDGTYTIQVYLVRAAARRGESSDFQIHVGIDNEAATAEDAEASHEGTADEADATTDALVEGTPFHATGSIDCTFAGDESVTSCEFGVIREGPAVATVEITFPDGFKRTLAFDNGNVTSPQTGEVIAHREGDLTFVSVDDSEHFAIPDAVIEGG